MSESTPPPPHPDTDPGSPDSNPHDALFEMDVDNLLGADVDTRPTNHAELTHRVLDNISSNPPTEAEARYLNTVVGRINTAGGGYDAVADAFTPTVHTLRQPGGAEVEIDGADFTRLQHYRDISGLAFTGVDPSMRPGPTTPYVETDAQRNDPDYMVVRDSYFDNKGNPHPATGNDGNEAAIATIHQKARANADYHAAAARAAQAAAHTPSTPNHFVHNKTTPPPPSPRPHATAGANENLRDALDVPVPEINTSRTPTPERDLTDKEKKEFDILLDALEKSAEERYRYNAADDRARKIEVETGKPQDTEQEKLFWYGDATHKGRLALLTDRLQERLDANNKYRELLRDRLARHDIHIDSTVSEIDRREATLGDKQSLRTLFVEADERDITTASRRSDPVLKPVSKPEPLPKNPTPDQQAEYDRQRAAYDAYLDSERRYKSWYNRRFPEDSRIPLVGAVMRGVAQMRPSRRKEGQRNYDKGEWLHGDGGPDPLGTQNQKKWQYTMPEEGTVHWERERGMHRARAELHVAQAAFDLEQSQHLNRKAEIRRESLLEIITEVDKNMGRAGFEKANGSSMELEGRTLDLQERAFQAAFGSGALSEADDHALFANLLEQVDYLHRIDQKLETMDPVARAVSYNELLELGDKMLGGLYRSRFRHEQLRLMTIANQRGRLELGYMGHRPVRYSDDKGIRINDQIVVYEDGTIRDERLGDDVRRTASGAPVTFDHAPTRPIFDVPRAGRSVEELESDFENSMKTWFVFQIEKSEFVGEARSNAAAVIAAAEEALNADPDDIDARIARNRAGYWLDYMALRPGDQSGPLRHTLAGDGSLVGHVTYSGEDGDWSRHPDGSADKLDYDAMGRARITERRTPSGSLITV